MWIVTCKTFQMWLFTCEIHMWGHIWNFTSEVTCEKSHVKAFICDFSYVAFHMWKFTCGISHVKFYMWNLICEISHVKFHMWNFTCDSHVKFHMWKYRCFTCLFICDVPITHVKRAYSRVFHMCFTCVSHAFSQGFHMCSTCVSHTYFCKGTYLLTYLLTNHLFVLPWLTLPFYYSQVDRWLFLIIILIEVLCLFSINSLNKLFLENFVTLNY